MRYPVFTTSLPSRRALDPSYENGEVMRPAKFYCGAKDGFQRLLSISVGSMRQSAAAANRVVVEESWFVAA
jgi:hypothetical protein